MSSSRRSSLILISEVWGDPFSRLGSQTTTSGYEMKDLSFFLLKNSFGARMKKGIRTFCSGDSSTSTLQQVPPVDAAAHPEPEAESARAPDRPPTLEEMILQLELEEEIARTQKLEERLYRRRMSSVNSSDILRSAQNAALNQYPRFSLDGRDAMYRSSFRTPAESILQPGRRSVCGAAEYCSYYGQGSFRTRFSGCVRPPERKPLGGETVVWCKPGVVAKLMGLEVIPVPVGKIGRHRRSERDLMLKSSILRQNLRRRAERDELERRAAADSLGSRRGRNRPERSNLGTCSGNGYCIMKPVLGADRTTGGSSNSRPG
ncbi:hypothetical protein SAY87_016719 [Trapa incisa]|uniref:DUF3741 domain-containing protein n=1 Tax=Trapa incisa TaxID=236973 RepID=A0AAN7L1Q1_9MYRT|nr:hypothetical protein SAY87_016719 [Trapa incisa]